jgi:putative DNA primase/helicase
MAASDHLTAADPFDRLGDHTPLTREWVDRAADVNVEPIGSDPFAFALDYAMANLPKGAPERREVAKELIREAHDQIIGADHRPADALQPDAVAYVGNLVDESGAVETMMAVREALTLGAGIAGRHADESLAVVKYARTLLREGSAERDRGAGDDGVRLVRGDNLKMERGRWLIDGRIPLGNVTIILGEPGLAKTTVAMDWAAELTRGTLDGDVDGAAPVIVSSAEDSPTHTLLPRFIAAGGDPSLLFVAEMGTLVLPDGIGTLKAQIVESGARMLIIDPLSAHLHGRIDSHRDASVRRAMGALTQLAEECDVAVVCIQHPNKGSASTVTGRANGSVAFIAAVRSVLMVVKDKRSGRNAETDRLLLHSKSNLGPARPTLEFSLETASVGLDDGAPIEVGRIVWGEEAPDITTDDVLKEAPSAAARAPARQEAETFLRDVLAEGPVLAVDLYKAADEAGVKRRTLERASKQLSVVKRKDGEEGRSTWRLPDSAGEGDDGPTDDPTAA